MLEVLKVLIFTAAVSFVGSFQLGPLGILVVHSSLKYNLKGGVIAAFGGILPEFIYTIFALLGFEFLRQSPSLLKTIEYLVIPIFLILGTYNYFSKEKQIQSGDVQMRAIFKKGFLYSLLNPMILIFWVVSLVFMHKHVHIETIPQKGAFVLGSGLGAFSILFIFAYFSIRYKEKALVLFNKYPFNKLLGVVFIGVALIQVIKLWWR